jgi:thiamine biosynthesis lipoprotein
VRLIVAARANGRRLRMQRTTPAWLLVCLALLAGCTRPALHQQESYVFGTRVEVLVHGEDREKAREAAAAVLREFDRLHRKLHAWQPSELTRLNEAIATGATAEVDGELAAILSDTKRIAMRSGDLFNAAIGRLIGLWGFQSDEFKPVLPPADEVARLVQARPAMSDLEIDGLRVGSGNREVRLDLGGYAKGYALDRAAAILRGSGIRNALINVGGNVMALGSKGGQPWRVGIQDPRGPAPVATLELRDGEAIGTSGDYQRYFELDGVRYCHILDPRTGRPAAGTRAVTVLVTARAGAGALSDAASKPLFVAGRAGWRQFARDLDIDHALRIDADGSIAVTRALWSRLEPAQDGLRTEIIE